MHATLVADFSAGRWRGALIRGASGTGKSTLALRCLSAGFRLVADDRVLVWVSGGRLWGAAPGPLSGLLEVRSVGIVPARALDFVEIALVVDLVEATERYPEPSTVALGTLTVRCVELNLADRDLPLRLRAALRRHL